MLQNFNAWGEIKIKGGRVEVTLHASSGGRLLDKTVAIESTRSVPDGQAAIAVDISPDGYNVQVREKGDRAIASHPEVVKVIASAVDWIRNSV